MTRARILSVARVERRKLRAQAPLRVLVLAGVAGPFAFALVLRLQNGTPADALFGTWVHQSGGALALVVLSFAANWGFPVIAGVLAGDLFASEDRHGTWKTVLTRSRSLRDVFAGKVLAAFSYALALALLVAVASVVAGVVVVGTGDLVDFGGRVLGGLGLLWRVVAAWLMCLPAVLAYASLAVLFSVATRSGIVGVLGPVMVALLTQLLALIGKGVIVHMLLIGTAFDAWHGLFADGIFLGPWLVSLLVCAAWIAGCLAASWRILRRREFVAGAAPTSAWRLPVRAGVGAVAVIALLALGSGVGPAGVTGARLRGTLLTEFRRLTALQQNLLGHPIPATAHYRILPVCNKRGAAPVGPGDWSCTMNVYVVLASGQQPLTDTPVAYDVSVQSNGCLKASSPPNYVGAPMITDTRGRRVVNPLVVIYGCFNIL
ncbi:MAG TPA: ABC transporter permease [Solirubrobacteraceae bacterium]|nr:ABC transporter permease [Solirubrobacteraceae bacterium]